MRRGFSKLVLLSIILVFTFSFASAWNFNGTTYDINGNPLNNTLINVTIWSMAPGSGPTLIGSNSNYSYANGSFSINVSGNPNWMYKPIITHTNLTTGSVDWIGQSLPEFPYFAFANINSVSFYLKPAGTLNISAVNATGSPVNFQYVVKDTKLGYPIAEGFGNYTSFATVYVPRDRNYSIMIYPNESLPVSYDWNNFTANESYPITAGLSDYNITTHTLNKTFNVTENLIWVNGYALNQSGEANFTEFTVIPFILEPGNMVYLGEDSTMPYNMSSWRVNSTGSSLGLSDQYNLTAGTYNITLPGPAESVNYLLFATAKGADGKNYGGYRNISLNYGSVNKTVNFTMYPLMSTDWASINSNITMIDAENWSNINISSAKQQFNLLNTSSNQTLSNINAHLEIAVDYSDYNATEFTFMTDLSSGNASFYLPLLNTSVEEMNIYSQTYAPKRVGKKTAVEILANPNITMASFNPGDIQGKALPADISVALYKSNSTCDVPNPPDSCIIANSAAMDSFNPLSSVIGGGKLSFRMGLLSSGIIVEYVDVDMLASGPPDAMFDDSATTTTSGDFESAMRFGSNGPTIYDHVLISIPYTKGSTSQTGLNDSAQVNVSIPLLYGDSWNAPIWNANTNGTNGTLLAANYSHYSEHASEWQTLMGENSCIRNQSEFNETNPCYIDTTNHRIWLRIPHFSGVKPSVIGSVITATPTSTTTTTSSGSVGGSAIAVEKKNVHLWTEITPGNATIMKDFDKEIGIKQIQIEVNHKTYNVKITVTKYDKKPAAVSVEKSGKVYQYLHIDTENLLDNLTMAKVTIRVNKTWVFDNNLTAENISLFKFDNASKAWKELETKYTEADDNYFYYEVGLHSFSYFAIAEKALVSGAGETETGNQKAPVGTKRTLKWWGIVLIVLGVLLVIYIIYLAKKKNYKLSKKE